MLPSTHPDSSSPTWIKMSENTLQVVSAGIQVGMIVVVAIQFETAPICDALSINFYSTPKGRSNSKNRCRPLLPIGLQSLFFRLISLGNEQIEVHLESSSIAFLRLISDAANWEFLCPSSDSRYAGVFRKLH